MSQVYAATSTTITAKQVQQLKLQHHLDYAAPLADATFVGTHNSNSSLAENSGQAFPNHDASYEEQMDYGARLLNYDIYYDQSRILMCHGICGGFEKQLPYGLQEMVDWLNKPGNGDEVIILFLQDGLKNDSDYDLAVSYIRQLGGRVYTPKQHLNTDKICSYLPLQTISKQKIRDDGANIVIVSFNTALDESCDKGGHEWRDWVWGMPVLDASNDIDNRVKRYPNQWANIAENRAPGTAGQLSFNSSTIDGALRRGAGLVGLDYLLTVSPNRHDGLIWSWRANEPNSIGNEDCAALNTSDGWNDELCTNSFYVACQSTIDGHWQISSTPGSHDQGQNKCDALTPTTASDYIFSVPINANLNKELEEARTLAQQSNSAVGKLWLNYSDKTAEGEWVVHNFVSRHVQEFASATQTLFFDGGNVGNRFRYFQIPVNTPYDEITFEVKGGDGGRAKMEFSCVLCTDQRTAGGGSGARISATFKIGNGPNEIPPGSGIGFVVGQAGGSDYRFYNAVSCSLCLKYANGGGGGGSAVLLFPPNSDNWKPLIVSGGGGGAYSNWLDQRDSGGNGGSPVSSGSTDGGDHGGSVAESAGGGGFMGHGKGTFCLAGNTGGGRAGRFGGGNGGVAGDGVLLAIICPGPFRNGGFGFGGGGSSGEGAVSGGGGGGYKGGNGGANTKGGSGGGSFVDSMRSSQSAADVSSTESPQHGFIKYEFRITNTAPVADNDGYSVNEDNVLNVSAANGVLDGDTDADSNPLTAVKDTDPGRGSLTLNANGSFTYTPVADYCGSDSFTYHASDAPPITGPALNSNVATVSITVTCVNDAPLVTGVSPASQTIDYSDHIGQVAITATDVDNTSLTLSQTGAPASLPAPSLASTQNCTAVPNDSIMDGSTCTWTMDGQVTDPEALYNVDFTANDGALNSVTGPPTNRHALDVKAEMASVRFDAANPVVVQVAAPSGDSGIFNLTVLVSETVPDLPRDGSKDFGDISKAMVSMELVPVAQGRVINGTCTPLGVTGTGYDQVLEVACEFDGVPVNTYAPEATVDGGYYSGFGEDVLVIFDPSLGFTTGGGWFYWPGSEDANNGYAGDRTNFGFNMKYNKKGTKVQGSLLMIRHLADGSKYRIKSNALHGLAVSPIDNPYGWASFSGKSTYLEPGWPEPVGNHQFTAYVEDHGEPGTADRVWIEVRDKDGVILGGLSLPRPADASAMTIRGGNIVVPHGVNNS